MKKINSLIRGTLILTAAGFLSRIIGFFYRIFLSHTIGAEGMGIYQMVFPVFSISFSITGAGIQTAISRFVAAERTKKFSFFLSGLTLSLMLSAVMASFLYRASDIIAVRFLMEARTAPLIRILAFSIPFESIHCCVNGYCLGLKKAEFPSATQLVEQTIRVSSVFAVYYIILSRNMEPTISVAVVGIVFGEFAAMIVSFFFMLKEFLRDRITQFTIQKDLVRILRFSAPLSCNRVVINMLASLEAIHIPNSLRLYGLSDSEALSIYGVLTGMALPMILFPGAITNSISVMLLPEIAEAEASRNTTHIKKAIDKTIRCCFCLGLLCTAGFLITGSFVGRTFFNNELAGTYIRALCFICPLLFMASPLTSILNGLGQTTRTFFINLISLGIRLAFVYFAIPHMGINGYFCGLIVSEIAGIVILLFFLRKYM